MLCFITADDRPLPTDDKGVALFVRRPSSTVYRLSPLPGDDGGLAAVVLRRDARVGVEPDDAAREVERHAVAAQEVAADYPGLLEPGRLVDRLHVEHGRVDVPPSVGAEREVRQQERLDVLGRPRRAVDLDVARLRIALQPGARRQRL